MKKMKKNNEKGKKHKKLSPCHKYRNNIIFQMQYIL